MADVQTGARGRGARPAVPPREASGGKDPQHPRGVQRAAQDAPLRQHHGTRARPPEGVRGGKRNDSAPRATRRALVRWRVETYRSPRHFRRRQRGVRGTRRRDRRAAGVSAPVGRADPARAAAGGTRRQAHQAAVRRAGARRGGRQGAREGAGVARPAAGAGRQAQVARLLLSALAFGCASQGTPPGGPPRTTPAAILRTVPESGTVVPDFRGKADVQFDEVIDEAPGSPGPSGGAITGLAQRIVLSPVAGDVKVSWHRSAIHVAPEEGWKPNRVYHLEVLPGIADLRRNVTKTGTTIVFSTGGALPGAALRGTALLWVEQRLLTQAVIRAAPLPDTAAYVTLTDSAGNFRLREIPSRRYRVWALQGQNNNRRQDRREPFDTGTVTVDSTASALLLAVVHDTPGPRSRPRQAVESGT